jgi:hypothetical protein
MTKRAQVYGRYTLGSGSILQEKDRVWSALADETVVASYARSIRRDFDKAGIPVEDLSKWHVMDVGTGRQALAFLAMGAQKVSHFDISHDNVARVEAHIAENGLAGRLDTTCCDLVEADLGRERYDFIYLNGIAQHFSDVGRGVVNCSFDQFFVYMLRNLVGGGNVASDAALMRDHYAAARMFYAADAADNYLTSIYMDGVFTRYAHLYTVETYLNFARACGLELISSSGLDPLGRSVDHYFARNAGVVTLRKVSETGDLDLAVAAKTLAPEAGIDQLDILLYEAPEIRRSVELYGQLKMSLAAPDVPSWLRVFVAMRLFALLAQTRAPDYDAMRRHADLHELLERSIGLLASEYGTASAGGVL